MDAQPTMRRVPLRPAAVLTGLTILALLAGAGCSGSTSHRGSGPSSSTSATAGPGASKPGPVSSLGSVTRTPCALITKSEAERAAGQPLGPALENADPAECTYAASDSTASVVLDVGTWAGIARVLAAVKTGAATGLQKVALPGVGDDATALSGRGGTPILYVRKGKKGFVLSISGPEVDDLPDGGLAQATTLAVAIAARL
ncbi:MAG: hypothetical protein DLM59_04590 [Pseudonocardiales bacterium]|nr:MAG: hypothetical protein DLM59_04590 [Pseudonocardiales bacterium]